MELEYVFFADHAQVPPDGKLYVLGGGFSNLALPQLPGRASFAVVAGFRFGAADGGKTHKIELKFTDDKGALVIPPATLQFQSAGPPPGDREITLPTVTYLAPMFGEAGVYCAEYWAGERMLVQARLHVEQQAPGMTGRKPN